jgi:hypothetical protein
MLDDQREGKPVANIVSSDLKGDRLQALQALLTAAFWRRTFNYWKVLLPKCLLPALLVNGALILMVVANVWFYRQLSSGTIKFYELIQNAAICLLLTGAGLVMFIVGFGKWVYVLTAFCRYWFDLEREATLASFDRSILGQKLVEALEEVKANGAALTKYWLRLLAIMLAPIVILYLLAACKIAGSRNLAGGALFSLPAPVDAALIPLCALIAVFILIISFLSVPVAAFLNQDSKRSVDIVFLLAKNKLGEVLCLTAIVVLLNILLGSPLAFLHASGLKGSMVGDQAVQLCIAQQIWQGVLSVILLPLSLVPFCQLLKDLAYKSA